MTINVNLGIDSYDIRIEKGILNNLKDEINLNRKVMIVTDSGVPADYSRTVQSQCKEGYIETIKTGEESKSLESFSTICASMLKEGFTRGDAVVAVGGGVVGDLAGYIAASFMRGIDFYNIPTTILSQVDSSIGGKTAVNFCGVKNIIGAFYQPKKVIIDTELYKTLPARQVANGLAEAVKMALTCDKELFEEIEKGYDEAKLYDYVTGAIRIKKMVVEEDVKEKGLRKVLNFGHTIGHGIEVAAGEKLYHGEAVGLGMLLMCDDKVKSRLLPVMKSLGLPTEGEYDKIKALEAISHDKKSKAGAISTVYVNEVGSFEFRDMTMDEITGIVERV